MRDRLARAFLVPFVLVAMAIDGSLFDLTEHCERDRGNVEPQSRSARIPVSPALSECLT
jgi:hypothetical protein